MGFCLHRLLFLFDSQIAFHSNRVRLCAPPPSLSSFLSPLSPLSLFISLHISSSLSISSLSLFISLHLSPLRMSIADTTTKTTKNSDKMQIELSEISISVDLTLTEYRTRNNENETYVCMRSKWLWSCCAFTGIQASLTAQPLSNEQTNKGTRKRRKIETIEKNVLFFSFSSFSSPSLHS